MEQKTGLRSHVEELTTMFPEFTAWSNIAENLIEKAEKTFVFSASILVYQNP